MNNTTNNNITLPSDKPSVSSESTHKSSAPSVDDIQAKVEPEPETSTAVDNTASESKPVELREQPQSSSSTSLDAAGESAADDKPVQKNKDRCFSCRAKLTIAKQISNKCRCELIFCDSHKQPSVHDCHFDHQSHARSILSKKNSGLDEQKGGSSFTRI